LFWNTANVQCTTYMYVYVTNKRVKTKFSVMKHMILSLSDYVNTAMISQTTGDSTATDSIH